MRLINFKFFLLSIVLGVYSNAWAGTDDICVVSSVKWNPGNYLLLWAGTTDAAMPKMISEITEYDFFKGLQRRYMWRDLEPSKGVYDFSSIKKDLQGLAAVDKRLVLQIQVKSFGDGTVSIPNYLLNSTYGGGFYESKDGGTNLAYWNKNVQSRMIMLLNEMGKQLDSHPNLEAVNFVETAPSMYDRTLWNNVADGYIEGMTNVVKAAKVAFPNTVVIQYINYPIAYLADMVAEFKGSGVGIGGPDVYTEQSSLIDNAYGYIRGVSGVLPTGTSIQFHNFTRKRVGGTVAPTIEELDSFAKNELKVNYVFWLRRTATSRDSVDYYKRITDYLGSKYSWEKGSAGGVVTDCPAIFAKCITN